MTMFRVLTAWVRQNGSCRFCMLAIMLVAISGCSSLFGGSSDDKNQKLEGKRVSVMETSRRPTADKRLDKVKPVLPQPVVNKDWPQAGGNTQHTLLHPALAAYPEVLWSSDIGYGSKGYYRLLSRPVVGGGTVFTLDARGGVEALNAETGDKLWSVDTTPEDRDEEAMGGGIGFSEGVLYVTTGFGDVVALKSSDGSVIWRKMLGKPLRAAPTIADNRVYVVSIDNELNVLSTKNGEVLWHHNGIAETATLMGASNPAVDGDSVVVTYSSGEIFNLRAQNGRVAWTDVLAVPELVGALPAIADIRGLPVIDKGRVFAVSHSGRMAAIDQRTGDRAWEADVGGINTPLVSGDTVFLVTNNNELLALRRDSGRVAWINELQRLEDPADRDSDPIFWWGPVLAGGRLWLSNSKGHVLSFDPDDGGQLSDIELSGKFFIPPVVANNIMYVLNDDGKLTALR